MKRAFIIIIATLLFCASLSAQNIRLGEKVPEISVESLLGDELRMVTKEHTCIAFMHSQCEPCVTALPTLHQTIAPFSDKLAMILVTNESKEMEEKLKSTFGSYVETIAFDRNNQTYRAFGINFVPFAVIYNTKSRRIEWFGSIQQLDNRVLNSVCK